MFSLSAPPARPSHCKLDNLTAGHLDLQETTDVNEVNHVGGHAVSSLRGRGLLVQCTAGFDGGLPQTFLLEVRHEGRDLIANQSVASRPYFKVRDPFIAFILGCLDFQKILCFCYNIAYKLDYYS